MNYSVFPRASSAALALFLVHWIGAELLVAESVTIEPVADTGLFELDPEINMGRNRDAPAGTLGSMGDFKKCRMLLRFGIADAVPAGSTITAATLRMRVTRTPESGKQNSDFALHRMLVSWNEGDGIGDIPGGRDAVAGESTWSHRVFPNTLWDSPGVEAGAEYSTAESATTRVFGNGEYVFNFSPEGVADLQSMLDEDATNFGWMFKSKAEATGKTARRFGTRENITASYRPRLEISYDPPATAPPSEPEVIESSVTDSGIMIRFVALAGVQYAVESTQDIAPENWSVEETYPPPSEDTEQTFTSPLSSKLQRFYRIRAEQP